MIFAQLSLDFGLTEGLFSVVRIIASIGGAVVGWFVCDPLTRLIYRLSFKSATPAVLLLGTKGGGAATLALLIYFFMPLGGGGGGLGWGTGTGGGPGKGPGQGGDKAAIPNNKDEKPGPKDKVESPTKSKEALEAVEIEIISVKLFQDDGMDRFYLLRRAGKKAEAPMSPGELEEFLKKNVTKIEVTPVLTSDSIAGRAEDNPLSQLLALTKRHKIKTLQTRRP